MIAAAAGAQDLAIGIATGSSSRVRSQTRRAIEIPTPTQRFVEKKLSSMLLSSCLYVEWASLSHGRDNNFMRAAGQR